MIIEKATLNSENQLLKIKINPEDPFIHISYSRVGYENQETNETKIVKIEIRLNYIDGKIDKSSAIYSNDKAINEKFSSENLPIIDNPNIKYVEIELIENNLTGFELDLVIQKGRSLIDVKNPLKDFKEHIENGINTKIFFSGAFGQGKTVFLNHFFSVAQNDRYNVFQLFPVNYSVASNEDIFKYIKTDILFQLLGADIEFDKSSISITNAFQEYVYLNPKKTIVSFLKNVSHLNSNVNILSKSVEALNDFVKPILEYHAEQNIDDRTTAEKYVKEIYDREGSLFEDNFYTQLIKQLLERIKEKSLKENVLIIEDLDRIDPDHIFRILNVISAHYDTFKNNSNTESHNKFGFDKIIIVGDINNIENIFHHKYGLNTDFGGYINKFFSSKLFIFNNKDQIKSFIYSKFSKKNSRGNISPFQSKIISLLNLFHENDLISLRDILKLNENEFLNLNWDHVQPRTLISNGPFTPVLIFLIKYWGAASLTRKVEELKKLVHFQKFDNQEDAKILLASLGFESNGITISAFRNSVYQYSHEIHYDYRVIYSVDNIKCLNPDTMSPKPLDLKFNSLDFYDLLIENIKRLNENEK